MGQDGFADDTRELQVHVGLLWLCGGRTCLLRGGLLSILLPVFLALALFLAFLFLFFRFLFFFGLFFLGLLLFILRQLKLLLGVSELLHVAYQLLGGFVVRPEAPAHPHDSPALAHLGSQHLHGQRTHISEHPLITCGNNGMQRGRRGFLCLPLCLPFFMIVVFSCVVLLLLWLFDISGGSSVFVKREDVSLLLLATWYG
mmetsp:Transcript_39871/g.99773  ORF Transcript_39871/g.99773 Transcript_39871/m.99773 type:complete len:200 (+) Transcript_39871:184-783(+)